jgi:alpha-ribazole phosphatase/probable phosphoglycerate mutase
MTGSVELIFETHSLTTDNELGIATGWLGGRLSARGCELAGKLGKRRRVDGIDAVFTSDLARAVETARIAFSETGIPVVLDWRLRELDYGDLNGETVDVVARERVLRIEEPFPGGESYRDAVARVEELLDDLLVEHDGQRILLIGHTATRWALDHLLDGKPLERLVREPFAWREGWEYALGRSVASASR